MLFSQQFELPFFLQNHAIEWADRAAHFIDFSRQVHGMMMRLLNIPNRSLLYDFYPYIWDMEGVIAMLASFVKWLGKSLMLQS